MNTIKINNLTPGQPSVLLHIKLSFKSLACFFRKTKPKNLRVRENLMASNRTAGEEYESDPSQIPQNGSRFLPGVSGERCRPRPADARTHQKTRQYLQRRDFVN